MMRVRVFRTADALARALASDIARRLTVSPNLVLGLPTGATPIPLYRELVRLHQRGRVDFRRAATFNLDEFIGIAPDDSHSYRAFMQRHLFDRVDLAPRRIHFLNGAAPNVTQECERYERAILRSGGIDVQILGLGTNGHIGFNEPGRALQARTHRTRLKPATRRANARWFENRTSAVPREALSMGMATILQAKRIVLLATGANKAPCVQRMIEGPVTPRLPASFLQLHRHAEIWIDSGAARNVEI
jgi:glucosamine-6-phosphate deaminase